MAFFPNLLSTLISGSKFNIGLTILLLHQGLSEPKFHSDLVYKLKELWIRLIFDQFRKVINTICYNHSYSFKGMRQSPCFVINPSTISSFADLVNAHR